MFTNSDPYICYFIFALVYRLGKNNNGEESNYYTQSETLKMRGPQQEKDAAHQQLLFSPPSVEVIDDQVLEVKKSTLSTTGGGGGTGLFSSKIDDGTSEGKTIDHETVLLHATVLLSMWTTKKDCLNEEKG